MRSRLSLSLGALVSAVAVAAVVWWILRQNAPTLPHSAAGFSWLLGSLALSIVAYAVRGWRWHRVMRIAAVDHRALDAYALTTVAYMGNTVLPARGGELLKVALLGPRSTSRRREILGSVVAERLLDAGALVVVFVVMTWAGVDGSPTGRAPAFALAAAVVLVAGILAAYFALRRRRHFERFADRIRPVARASKLLMRPAGVTLLVVSVAIWLLEGLNLLLIARAVGLHLRVLDAVLTMAVASLFAALPVAPGYAGTYDAGMLLGLEAAGAAGSAAVGVLLLARFMLFVPVTVVGLAVLIARYGGLRPRGRRGRSPGSDRRPRQRTVGL
jgi:glycosyltransferase 2 family protein